jgi:hypothetical protein
MFTGGKKYQKTTKTKFRKNKDHDDDKQSVRQRHHDKSFYRLVKEEKKEYVV